MAIESSGCAYVYISDDMGGWWGVGGFWGGGAYNGGNSLFGVATIHHALMDQP